MSEAKVTLSGEAADRLLRLVAEQNYARPEDAMADALDALEANTAPSIDKWLKTTISARAEALAADPSRAMTADEVRARILKA
jgi:hypothetical protein